MVSVRALLIDIIGTTTPLSYRDTMFRDFAEHGEDYLKRHPYIFEDMKKTLGVKSKRKLVNSIRERLEHKQYPPEFMRLIGLVNIEGYEQGRLKPVFYQDIAPAFKVWHDHEVAIALFSNIYWKAQQSMFRQAGLESFIAGYYDTGLRGSKQESQSYYQIAVAMSWPRNRLYLADDVAELKAAEAAHFGVALVVREHNLNLANGRYASITSFEQVSSSLHIFK